MHAILKQKNLQKIIFLDQDPNITYLTKRVFSHARLEVTKRAATLFISKLDKKPSYKKITVKLLKKQEINTKITKIGINANVLTLSQFNELKELYPKTKFTDISRELTKLRTTKTKQELQLIKKAAKITDDTFKAICKNIKQFKTELDIKHFIEKEFHKKNAQEAFPSIVATGKNSAIPHHITSTNKIEKGFLLIDFGAKYKGYCADMTRMIYLGKPTKTELEHYNLLKGAQEHAITLLKTNLSFQDIDKQVRKQLGKLAKYFTHSLGHGIGVEVHEAPSFKTDKVQTNQIFTIEPGIYLKNYGIRVEDTIHFNQRPNTLTRTSKELFLAPL